MSQVSIGADKPRADVQISTDTVGRKAKSPREYSRSSLRHIFAGNMADRADPIILSSDSEDEDLRAAIALSLQNKNATIGGESNEHEGDGTRYTEDQGMPQTRQSGLAVLDRKQMEEERLERLAKRRLHTDNSVPPPKKRKVPADELSSQTKIAKPAGDCSSYAAPSLPFAKPVVKRTWAYGFPRTLKDIKIEEVLDRRNLQLAVLSSFQWDENWLLSKIDVSKTKLLLLAFAANHAQASFFAKT